MRKRMRHIHFMLNQNEYEELSKKQKNTGLSQSAFMRSLINGCEIKERPSIELHSLYTEINRIGTNVNQIAHAANLNGVTDSLLEENLKLLRELYVLFDSLAV